MEIATRYLDKVIPAARVADLQQAQEVVDILVKAYRGNRSVFVIGKEFILFDQYDMGNLEKDRLQL